MRKILTIIAASTISCTVFASTTIISGMNSRNKAFGQTLTLSADGSTCLRTTNSNNKLKVDPETTVVESSDACKSLQIGAEIEKNLGHKCEFRSNILKVSQDEDRFVTQMDSVVVSGSDGFAPSYHSDSLTPTSISQSCVCGHVNLDNGSVGLGSLNILENFFNGPYWKSTVKMTSVSAKDCAQMFDTEAEKQIVSDAYAKFGSK